MNDITGTTFLEMESNENVRFLLSCMEEEEILRKKMIILLSMSNIIFGAASILNNSSIATDRIYSKEG